MPLYKCSITFSYTVEVMLEGATPEEVKSNIESATNEQVAHFHGKSYVQASEGVFVVTNIEEVTT